jgi:membrane protein
MTFHRRWISIGRQAIELWTARNAFQHAGALAFYTLFSMAPLFIILIAMVAAVLGEEAARGEIAAQIQTYIGPQAADAVEHAVLVSRVEAAGVLPTLVGIGVLLFGATTVFGQLQSSLNQFWGVVAKPSRSGIRVFLTTRLLSLGLVLIIGFLLLTSLVISIAIAAIITYAEQWIPIPAVALAAVDLTVSLGIATLLFAMIFKVLPDVRLEWGHVWRGALVTAVLFVAGQYVISIYLTQTAPGSTYGAAGSLVAVLMWVYYSSLILFLGTALTKAAILVRGGGIVPKATAVRTTVEILEEEPEGKTRKVETPD